MMTWKSNITWPESQNIMWPKCQNILWPKCQTLPRVPGSPWPDSRLLWGFHTPCRRSSDTSVYEYGLPYMSTAFSYISTAWQLLRDGRYYPSSVLCPVTGTWSGPCLLKPWTRSHNQNSSQINNIDSNPNQQSTVENHFINLD